MYKDVFEIFLSCTLIPPNLRKFCKLNKSRNRMLLALNTGSDFQKNNNTFFLRKISQKEIFLNKEQVKSEPIYYLTNTNKLFFDTIINV